MKIAVLGAGIVGVTTAYELASDGHEVTVFERRSAVAEETSFANAGIVAPGYVTPWAAPGMPAKVLAQLRQRHGAVQLAWPLGLAELRWMWRWWRACKPEVYATHRRQLHELALFSRQRLHHLTRSLQLQYDRSEGFLVLLRGPREHELVQPGLQVLRELGVAFQEVSAQAARTVEPALHAQTALHGAVHVPGDEVGNCRQFALLLKNEAQRLGCQFEFNTTVARIRPDPLELTLTSAQGATRQARFDAAVLCAGVDSAALVRPLGLHLPLIAVHGHSISVSLREAMDGPVSAVMDERYKVAISRMGQRVRVAGGAELGGRLEQRNPRALQALHQVLADWYPGAARYGRTGGQVQEWKGARPMLPDRPPMVGASGVPGLWLNLGHGSSGWALSCGSARVLADAVAGRSADVPTDHATPTALIA